MRGSIHYEKLYKYIFMLVDTRSTKKLLLVCDQI